MIKLINNKILPYIIFSIPLSIIIGIAVTEVLCFILILFLFINIKDIKFLYDKKIIFLFFLAFYYALVAYLKIDGELKYSSFFYFRYVLISLSIFIVLDRLSLPNKTYLIIIFILCFLIFFDSWIQFVAGKNLIGYEIIKNRISGIFGNDLILGSFFVKIFPFLVWLIYFFKIDLKKNKNIFIFFLAHYL